jgi:phosphonate transport system permease protein
VTNLNSTSREDQAPAWLHPILATILSAILPGLGQILAKSARRGFFLLVSFATIIGLLAWRIKVAARRETEILEALRTAFRVEKFLIFIAIAAIVIYILIIIDAYQTTASRSRSASVLFILVTVAFFGLGWQISEINVFSLFSGLEEGGEKLLQIAWPWPRAIIRPEERLEGTAIINVPCVDKMSEQPQPAAGEPILITTPVCGLLSEQGGALGSEITISGSNFAPNTLTDLWWEDEVSNQFRQRQEGEYVNFETDAAGEFEVDIVLPYRLIPPSATVNTLEFTLIARQISGFGPAEASDELTLSIEKMIETIFLGMMATFFGILLAIPISFLAARNLMSANKVTFAIYLLVRTILNIIRSIEPLIWAIIAVVVVGLGPFAGVLALTLHSVAALGKLYSESIESIDTGPIEAIHATGANWIQTVVFAVIPQIIPPFVSFTIYRWDINVRMSTIIGLVGGGGIGFLLVQWIRLLDYRAAGIAVWFIAVTVAVLDYVSSEIRQRFT